MRCFFFKKCKFWSSSIKFNQVRKRWFHFQVLFCQRIFIFNTNLWRKNRNFVEQLTYQLWLRLRTGLHIVLRAFHQLEASWIFVFRDPLHTNHNRLWLGTALALLRSHWRPRRRMLLGCLFAEIMDNAIVRVERSLNHLDDVDEVLVKRYSCEVTDCNLFMGKGFVRKWRHVLKATYIDVSEFAKGEWLGIMCDFKAWLFRENPINFVHHVEKCPCCLRNRDAEDFGQWPRWVPGLKLGMHLKF